MEYNKGQNDARNKDSERCGFGLYINHLTWQLLLNEVGNIVECDIFVVDRAAIFIFQHAVIQSPVTDDNAMGNTDKLHVGKFYARALIAIIQQYVIAEAAQCCIEQFGLLANALRLLNTTRVTPIP